MSFLVKRLKTVFFIKNKLDSLVLSQWCSAGFSSKIRNTTISKERSLLNKDEVPVDFRLIYRAPMENYITSTNLVSTVTVSFVAVVAALHSSKLITPDCNNTEMLGLVSNDSDLYFFLAGFILINLAIRVFISRYPLRIYKNSGSYVAVYASQIPFRTVRHTFEQGEVVPVKNILNPWRDSTYRLGRRKSLLLLNHFKTPSEFHQLVFTK